MYRVTAFLIIYQAQIWYCTGTTLHTRRWYIWLEFDHEVLNEKEHSNDLNRRIQRISPSHCCTLTLESRTWRCNFCSDLIEINGLCWATFTDLNFLHCTIEWEWVWFNKYVMNCSGSPFRETIDREWTGVTKGIILLEANIPG